MTVKSDPNSKPDRRIQRTIRLLRAALMELVIEKGYDAVTIQDITDRADVARTTFYLHFRDKDELLFTSMQAMYDELLAAGPELSRDDLLAGELSAAMVDARDFEHAAQYAEFYRAILGKHGSPAFMAQLRTYMADMMRREALDKLIAPGQTARLPLEFMAHFMAGAHLGVMSWWLDNDMPFSAQDMARMSFEAALYGGLWALGLANKPTKPPEDSGD